MRKAVRTYLELAMGVTDTSTKKVRKAVEEAVGKGGATADQIKALTSDLMAARSANREGISKLVRFEVDRALGVVGLATADEVSELTARVRDLERQLRQAETGGDTTELDQVTATARRAANKRAAAKRTTAAATMPEADASPIKRTPRKTSSTRTTTSSATAAAEPPDTPVVRKTAARKTTARQTAAKTAVGKKTAATKTASKAQP